MSTRARTETEPQAVNLLVPQHSWIDRRLVPDSDAFEVALLCLSHSAIDPIVADRAPRLARQHHNEHERLQVVRGTREPVMSGVHPMPASRHPVTQSWYAACPRTHRPPYFFATPL